MHTYYGIYLTCKIYFMLTYIKIIKFIFAMRVCFISNTNTYRFF